MRPVDLTRVRQLSLGDRASKVRTQDFASPPSPGRSFSDFLHSLPRILAGADLLDIVAGIAGARRRGAPVVVGMGAHVVKCGLSPVIIDLMERGIVTALALNGAGAIHDVELALAGATSEDVAAGLRDGSFGMVRETADFLNAAASRVFEAKDAGFGALLGRAVVDNRLPNRQWSLLATGWRLSIPVTVHVAIGADIVHMHPSADGAAIGRASHNDFRLLAAVLSGLSGGVYMNVGSAVLLPEVFLKAFTVAQNLGANVHDFMTVNLDMNVHYRATENVVRRPPLVGGRGITLVGRHEVLIPLIAQAVVEMLAQPVGDSGGSPSGTRL